MNLKSLLIKLNNKCKNETANIYLPIMKFVINNLAKIESLYHKQGRMYIPYNYYLIDVVYKTQRDIRYYRLERMSRLRRK